MDISKVLSANALLKGAKKAARGAFDVSLYRKPLSLIETASSDTFLKAANKAAAGAVQNIDEKYLQDLSDKIYRNAKKDFPEYMAVLKKAFGDMGIPLTGRIKEPSSTFSKLSKRAHYIKEGYNPMSIVPDVYGFRLTTDGSPKQMETVVRKIEGIIEDGHFIPSHILNHGTLPYFNEEQITRLNQKGFLISPNAKKSGFSGVNMYFTDIFTGKKIELQIKGKKVHQLAEKEHLWYNFKTKGGALKKGVINQRLQKVFESLTGAQVELYEKYANDCYNYSRNIELGNNIPKPVLPKGLDSILKLL